MNIRGLLEKSLLTLWYGKQPLAYLLLPLSWIFYLISLVRRYYYLHLKRREQFPVPIIVVGNITVGGSGKTPLVIWLADYLKQQGFKPGIISRGYGGKAAKQPLSVVASSDPFSVGDEALLLATRTACPLVVAVDRVAAVKFLLANTDCNIVISDDGLQHYALARTLEIAVLDADRLCGNKRLLPAGPLREPVTRLQQVDLVVVNGETTITDYFPMQLVPQALRNGVNPDQTLEISALQGQKIHAVAGIGNPQRFFNTLRSLGMDSIEHAFPDHHPFQAADFNFVANRLPIVMTEKDAVKCQTFAQENFWYLPVTAVLSTEFSRKFSETLKGRVI